MSQISYVQFASKQIAVNYVTVAFVAIQLYDHVLTFGEEVEYIWKQKMSIGKLLFLLNRYIPMIDQFIIVNGVWLTMVNPALQLTAVAAMPAYVNTTITDNKTCFALFQANNWILMFSALVIDVIMLLRTWALWQRSRAVLIILSILLAVCMMAASASVLYFSLTVFEIPTISSISPCNPTIPRTDVLYSLWVSLSVFDSTIMIMTLIKALPALQSDVPMRLVAQLLKDGIQYFIIIFLASLVNIIMIIVAPGTLKTTLITSYSVMISTLGSRLVLNLRGSLLRTADDDESTAVQLKPLVFLGSKTNQQHSSQCSI